MKIGAVCKKIYPLFFQSDWKSRKKSLFSVYFIKQQYKDNTKNV